MIRTGIYLPKDQIARLKRLAKITGLSMAEHVRRAIDNYLTKEGRRDDRADPRA
jgi:predicted DNA-binding protein